MLSIRQIVKRYATHTALDGVSMEIPAGSIFGLLGPNGAGKTSLIRIINQITAPDSGEVWMNGEPLNHLHISQIGYLPEERGLYKKMEVGEQVIYFSQLKGLSRQDARERCRKWFLRFEIEKWWDKKVEDLSKGMQQKVQFISTVIHEPNLLILDEPFSGFDPINAELVKEEIVNFYKQGKSVIFSTHRLENIESFVTHIALLNRSKKILEGSVSQLITQFKTGNYRLEYRGEKSSLEALKSDSFKFISHADSPEDQASLFKVSDEKVNELLQSVMPLVSLKGVQELIPTVSDIFMEQVKNNQHE